MDYSLIYIPHPNKESAIKTAKILIEEELIACANIIDAMTSIYRWEGKIVEEGEVLLLAKSKSALFLKIQKRVEQFHPYTCPCIVAISLDQGNSKYLDWVNKSTQNI
ncbi:MAG: divalent-cation tolerance protein CutA [Oligoflexia bacterium]|nr:divalent-cation tolerance protein CutA [Oligoflexia bacterium]